MKSADDIKRFFKNASVGTNPKADDEILNQLIQAHGEVADKEHTRPELNIWRIIMQNKITKLATAAAIIIAAILAFNVFNQSIPTASAAQVLQEAIEAVSNLRSVHMNTHMRTLPADNFSLIGLNYDFVPIEMWKRTDNEGQVQWRVEKPGRVLLMDGKRTIMLIRPNHGVLEERPLPLGCFDSWSGRLLNVGELLDSELQNAKNNPDREVFLHHEDIEGQDKIILEVEVAANVPEGDYLRNTFITDSDHLKVYQFDAKTKLLEGLQVYVHAKDEDVLIFEITDIKYNIEFDGDVFVLDLPEDMIWYGEPQKLSDNKKYEKMSPKEAATAFFQACANEDWEEVLKFWNASTINDRFKAYLGGLTIISIGEPFQSEGYARKGLGWFVPYEIKLPAMEFNVRVSKENSAGRFVMTGICDSKLRTLRELHWPNEPETLPNNEDYVKMSPEDVVRAFNDALSRGDLDEMRKFAPDSFAEEQMQDLKRWKENGQSKDEQPFLEEVGEAFWSEEHSSYFVRCLLPGQVKKFNLAIRKDNPAGRFIVDGGI
jgi:hypothetical protein